MEFPSLRTSTTIRSTCSQVPPSRCYASNFPPCSCCWDTHNHFHHHCFLFLGYRLHVYLSGSPGPKGSHPQWAHTSWTISTKLSMLHLRGMVQCAQTDRQRDLFNLWPNGKAPCHILSHHWLHSHAQNIHLNASEKLWYLWENHNVCQTADVICFRYLAVFCCTYCTINLNMWSVYSKEAHLFILQLSTHIMRLPL